MKGKRVAILGLGRSGLAVGLAALRLGADPVVFDEKPEAQLPKRDLLEVARSAGIQVVLGAPLAFPLPVQSGWEPDLLVVNPAVPKDHPGIRRALELGIEVIGEIEFAYRISKARIVAITGTNGKSTTTVMTYQCLRACGVDAVLCGNIFGSGYPEKPLTEAALESTPDQVLVAEISSFQLDFVSTFKPFAAAITNVSADHLDRYDSFASYAAAKQRIFAFQGPGDTAVLPRSMARPGRGATERVLGEDALLTQNSLSLLGTEVPREELGFREEHNFQNAAVAGLLAAAVVGAMKPCIAEGLMGFRGLAHRMERLGSRRGIEVINNSMCTNPAAVVSSSQALGGRAHLLIGGVNKELDFEPLREFLAASDHRVYLFGSDSEELRRMLRLSEATYRTMEQAFEAATEQAMPGESIMLAPGCASTDQFRDFRHRGDVFKAIAMEWLKS